MGALGFDDEETLASVQRRIFRVSEHGNTDIRLSDLMVDNRLDLYSDVIARGYFGLRLKGTTLQLQAGGYVGLIALNDRVAIDVRPRVPVANLTRMLHLSGEAPLPLHSLSRMYRAEAGAIEPLLDVYTEALVAALSPIEEQGIYHTYDERREATSFPRGRLLVGETVTTLLPRGISHQVAASWRVRTADNDTNRCLKYAVWFLATRYGRMGTKTARARDLQRALNRMFRLFDGVSLTSETSFLRDPIVSGRSRLSPRLAYYTDAVELARVIVREQTAVLDKHGTDVRLSSLIVNMERVFEGYLREVLRLGAERGQWSVRVLDGNSSGSKPLFDGQSSPSVNPDIVLKVDQSGVQFPYPLILEAKYKPAPEQPDRVDTNQAITYGASYRCNRVVLVYPRGHASVRGGLQHAGTIGQLSIERYVYDLGATDLREEERAFCAAVAGALFAA